jgi:hypothetical protein
MVCQEAAGCAGRPAVGHLGQQREVTNSFVLSKTFTGGTVIVVICTQNGHISPLGTRMRRNQEQSNRWWKWLLCAFTTKRQLVFLSLSTSVCLIISPARNTAVCRGHTSRVVSDNTPRLLQSSSHGL